MLLLNFRFLGQFTVISDGWWSILAENQEYLARESNQELAIWSKIHRDYPLNINNDSDEGKPSLTLTSGGYKSLKLVSR